MSDLKERIVMLQEAAKWPGYGPEAQKAIAWAAEVLERCIATDRAIEQVLGKALGYPRYCDDQKNFPGSTEADGVCVGEHTPVTLALEAAERLRSMEAAYEDV